MSKPQTHLTALLLPSAAGSSDTTAISTLIKKYFFHWPLFLIAVILCLIGAYFYLQVTQPVYPITATLKFKTPTSASGAPLTINDNSLENLDPASNPIIVENEIEVMQSKKLIYQIVKDLQLWVNYSQKNGAATTDLYDKSPVHFAFTDSSTTPGAATQTLNIQIKNDRSFELKASEGNETHRFSTPVQSAFGTWQLEPTPQLPQYIGQTITIKISDPDLLSDSYQKGIKVELENKDAPFINLSMSDNVPARGKDVLNSLITLYRQNAQLEKNEQTQKILLFTTARVDSLRQDLERQERNLQAFKQSQGITDVAAQAEGFRNLKQSNTNAINDVNVQLSTLETLTHFVNNPVNSGQLPVGSVSLDDQSLVELYNRLATLQLERAQKAAITPAANPLFAPIDRQIAALKEDIKEKIQTSRAALLANRSQLLSVNAGVSSSLARVPNWQKEYNALVRDLESKENIYKFLSAKKEEIALRFASLIQDSEVVDDAHAGSASWPKVPVVYGVALLLGLGAAAGFIYARESMSDEINSRRQLEEGAEVPVLGELAHQDTENAIVISADKNRFAIGEQFRVLRTNLYHLMGNADTGRVTLFTSSVSGEGKSFVSSNLAITLAYANRKTIILEMDLRKPKLSSVFGLPASHAGISNYLNGSSSDVSALIQPSGIPNLDVLGCGAILPNPSELLDTDRLDSLIAELKKTYDDILIDSPPIHLVTDALIIGRVADVCLYIVRQGYTHKAEMDFIKEIRETNRFQKFTIVFNGVKRDATYGYGNYYDNKYNSYSEKKKWSAADSMKAFLKRF